jgi:putative peptidoglycan lipid II flippase
MPSHHDPEPEKSSATESSLKGESGAGWSYVVVFLGTTMQLLLQFALSVLLAKLYGSTQEMDVYAGQALILPISVSAVLAGTIGPVLITLLARSPQEVDRQGLMGLVLAAATCVSVVMALLGWRFSLPVMAWLHAGTDPEFIARSAAMFNILVWLIPSNTLIGLMQAMLNASLNFTIPVVAGVVGPLVTFCLVFLLAPVHGVTAVAWGTLWGACANVLIQGIPVLSMARFRHVAANWSRIRSVVRLFMPVLAAMLFVKIDPIIDRYVCSPLPTGSIAHLRYSNQLATTFLMLVSGTLSTVAFPRLARAAGQGKSPLQEETLNSLRILIILAMPAVAVSVFLPHPLIRDLFERGAFTPADTDVVARLLRIYSGFLIGSALGEFGAKTMYALHDSATPTIIGGTAMSIGFVLKIALVPGWGVLGLAAITSATSLSAGMLQLAVVVRRVEISLFRQMASQTLKCAVATLAALLAGWGVVQTGFPFTGIGGLFAGAIVYFGLLFLLDSTIPRMVFPSRVRDRGCDFRGERR